MLDVSQVFCVIAEEERGVEEKRERRVLGLCVAAIKSDTPTVTRLTLYIY